MTTVHVLGEGEPKRIVEWGLEGFGYSPAPPGEKADVLVVVGPTATWPTNTRTIRVALPEQEFDRTHLHADDLWLVPTQQDGQRLLAVAADAGVKVRMQVLTWSHPERIRRQPVKKAVGRVIQVFRGSGSLKVPAREGNATTVMGAADLVVNPRDLPQLLRFQHMGIPALVREGTPLAEYIEEGVNGLTYDGDVNDALEQLLQGNPRRKLRGMTVPQPGWYVARREGFVRRLEEAVTGARLRVVFAHGRKPGVTPWQKQPIGARGMRYQALVAYGAEVRHVPDLDELPRVPHDFIMLGGRIAPERIAAIRERTGRPIVLAMNDAILGMPGRIEWFQRVGDLVDLFFSGEPPELLPKVRAKVHHIHQAPLTLWGPRRGTVRAPFHFPEPKRDIGVIFMANQWYPRRIELVKRFTKVMGRLHFYGATPPPIPQPWHDGQVRGRAYGETMQHAVAVLSTSIVADREITSCRLFEACSVGAYVLAEEFPGCRDIYPDSCVAWWKTPEEAASLAKAAWLSPDSPQIRSMRWAAQEHTWRNYSAHDRVGEILETIHRELGIR